MSSSATAGGQHMTDDPYLENILGVANLFPGGAGGCNPRASNSLDSGFNGAYRVDKTGLSGSLVCADSVDEQVETIRSKEPISKEQLLFYFEVEFTQFDCTMS